MAVVASLADRIKSFADLLGVVLVFLTLFTGQRQEAIRALRSSGRARKPDATVELAIAVALGVVTVLTLLAGAALFVDAVRHYHPLAVVGPVRSLYLVLWVLLICLAVWQIALAIQALRLRGRLPAREPTP